MLTDEPSGLISAEAETTAVVPPIRSTAKVDILLVDDEPRNLDVLETLLDSADYRLVRALTADQALMLLLNGEFAAIVLDIQMPGMSGIELATLIKQRRRTQHIPIIFLTAYFQEDKDVLQGYGSGAVDYLTKPINPQILRSKIGVFVELFRKNRALAEANATLELEVAQRNRAEESLRQMNIELESRVRARTAELEQLNAELRAREQALRASEAQALEASRAKDGFLARLSHELRTPLSPVLLIASEAARNGALPVDVRNDFEAIAQHVTLEARLIDDLLDLTAISRGKLSLSARPIDIHAVLTAALAMVRSEIVQKSVQLVERYHAAPFYVSGDDVRLKQVFWNVLKNAIKFTPAGGRIEICTGEVSRGERMVVRVIDTGIGMTAEELSRIFVAFSQGDHATGEGRFGGLGLGLVIARMLVDQHGGSIQATSEGRNRGATFTIEFPIVSAAGIPDEREALAKVGPPSVMPAAVGAGLRILVVEDHEPTSATLRELLRRRGCDVVTARTLEAGRKVAAERSIDFVLSDVGLPDGDGCELMSELSKLYGISGVALTGYGLEEDVKRTRAAGCWAHLTKPISVKILDEVLRMMVERKASGAR